MPTGLVLMILLGCGDGGERCDRVGVAPATYASIAECNAEVTRVLPEQAGFAYPVIAARCEPAHTVQVAAR